MGSFGHDTGKSGSDYRCDHNASAFSSGVETICFESLAVAHAVGVIHYSLAINLKTSSRNPDRRPSPTISRRTLAHHRVKGVIQIRALLHFCLHRQLVLLDILCLFRPHQTLIRQIFQARKVALPPHRAVLVRHGMFVGRQDFQPVLPEELGEVLDPLVAAVFVRLLEDLDMRVESGGGHGGIRFVNASQEGQRLDPFQVSTGLYTSISLARDLLIERFHELRRLTTFLSRRAASGLFTEQSQNLMYIASYCARYSFGKGLKQSCTIRRTFGMRYKGENCSSEISNASTNTFGY